jgi:hypothetical protein
LLTDIVALQIAVLEAAAAESKDTVSDKAAFSAKLEGHLETKRRFSRKPNQPAEIADWVTRKKATLLKPLSVFAAASSSNKEDLIKKVKHDVQLLYRPRADSLQLAIPQDTSEEGKADPEKPETGLKDFLYEFYDLWRDSKMDEYLFQPPQQETYSRQDFLQEFQEKNPELYLCAICDATAYRTSTDSRVYTSIEHFFPRSIYPHLSCHPLNLIPICASCNSFIKGEKDPMDGHVLTDLVLPYQGQGLRELAYITLQPRVKWERGLHPLTIKMKPIQGLDLGGRIEAFNRLYEVEERWNDILEQIEEQAFRRMCQFFALDLVMSTSLPDSTLVSEKMDLLMAFTHRDNLGRDPFAFSLMWIMKGYIDQMKEHGDKASVYQALKAWAKEHGPKYEELKELADTIHKRVPT